MVFRKTLFDLSIAVITSALLGLPLPTQADTQRSSEEAAVNTQQQRRQYNEALVERVIRGTPPFTALKLAPGVHSVSYDSAWTEEGVFTVPGGPMYVLYELPLPPGATAGVTMRDIGTLDMGRIHPLAKPAYGAWKRAGYAGNTPIVMDQKQNLFALHGSRLVSVGPSFAYRPIQDEPNTCGTFADGWTCELGVTGSGVVVYENSTARRRRPIVTEGELDAALDGQAELQGTPPVTVFNFDGRDYLNFDGAIFEIDGTSLSIIGAGTPLAYTRNHIVLFDWHDSEHLLNEEEVP